MANKRKTPNKAKSSKSTKAPANAFAKWMLKVGWTRKEASEKIGVSEGAIYGYLRGNSPKTLAVRQKIKRLSKGDVDINDWLIPLKEAV